MVLLLLLLAILKLDMMHRRKCYKLLLLATNTLDETYSLHTWGPSVQVLGESRFKGHPCATLEA